MQNALTFWEQNHASDVNDMIWPSGANLAFHGYSSRVHRLFNVQSLHILFIFYHFLWIGTPCQLPQFRNQQFLNTNQTHTWLHMRFLNCWSSHPPNKSCLKYGFLLSWLVVSIPLKNISHLGWLFPIYGKIKNVPNHQPVSDIISTYINITISGSSFYHLPSIPALPRPAKRPGVFQHTDISTKPEGTHTSFQGKKFHGPNFVDHPHETMLSFLEVFNIREKGLIETTNQIIS